MRFHVVSQSRNRENFLFLQSSCPALLESPVPGQLGAVNEQSLAGCKESGGSLGLSLGLENEDKIQKEYGHLSPRLEQGPQSPASVTAILIGPPSCRHAVM